MRNRPPRSAPRNGSEGKRTPASSGRRFAILRPHGRKEIALVCKVLIADPPRGIRRFRWPDWCRSGESPSQLVKALALGQALKSGPSSAASFIYPSGVMAGSTLASRPPQSRCKSPCRPSIAGALCRIF